MQSCLCLALLMANGQRATASCDHAATRLVSRESETSRLELYHLTLANMTLLTVVCNLFLRSVKLLYYIDHRLRNVSKKSKNG